MTRKHLNIGHLFRLACTADATMPRPAPYPNDFLNLTVKEILADWCVKLYNSCDITIAQLSDYMSAIDQCHDEVAKELLACARAES